MNEVQEMPLSNKY